MQTWRYFFQINFTLSRKWRHCSIFFCWISSNLILRIRRKSNCKNVFYLMCLSSLVFGNELVKKGKKTLYFQNQPGSIYLCMYYLCIYRVTFPFVIYRAWLLSKTLTETERLRHWNSSNFWTCRRISLNFGILM